MLGGWCQAGRREEQEPTSRRVVPRRPRLRDVASWTLSLLATVATDAQASVVYDNLAPGGGAQGNDNTFANISRWGQQFTASSGGSVTDINLNLSLRDAQSGTFDVQLWSGRGTTPTASLVTLRTLHWADVPLNSGATNTSASSKSRRSEAATR